MKIAAVCLGVLYALVCEMAAFTMTGGGHGWLTPFFVGPLGLIIFSFSAYAALTATSNAQSDESAFIFAIVAAATVDVVVAWATLNEGVEYVRRGGLFAYVWIGLWLAGQLPLLYAIVRRVFAPKMAA